MTAIGISGISVTLKLNRFASGNCIVYNTVWSELCECIRSNSPQTVLQAIYFMTVNAACNCSAYRTVWRMLTLVCYDQSTVRTQLFATLACCLVLRVCALFQGLIEFCFVFRFDFLPLCWISRHESSVTLLLILRRCMKSFSAFCGVYRRARISRACVCRSFHDAPCLLGRSAVRAQPRLLQRMLGLFVTRCALVHNSLQTSCLQ